MELLHVTVTDEFGRVVAVSVPCPAFTEFDCSGRADVRSTFHLLTGRKVQEVIAEAREAAKCGLKSAAGAGEKTGDC